MLEWFNVVDRIYILFVYILPISLLFFTMTAFIEYKTTKRKK